MENIKTMTPFNGFPKMSRFSRDVIISEKIDGTNAQIFITDDGQFLCGSRTRWIVPGDDNFGFAAWAHANKDELMKLGPGQHFGEWWGNGIQRKYGIKEKRFSLFNVSRWINSESERKDAKQEIKPACCHIVPVLAVGPMDAVNEMIEVCIEDLIKSGSQAAPGFVEPEGIVIYHTAANVGFKKTLKDDHQPKSLSK